MNHNVWQKEKPQFDEECILLTAQYWAQAGGYYEYDLFQISQVDGFGENGEPGWYWGLICPDGEEWGDLADLKADMYLTMPLLKVEPMAQKGASHHKGGKEI